MIPHTSNVDGNSVTDEQLDNLIEEITEKLQAGQAIDLDVYAQRHPEYGDQIRKMLPTLQTMAMLGEGSGADENDAVGTSKEAIGDYRIVREIGRGGMGVVYEAHQLSLGRRVALKILPFAAVLDQRQLQRFKNEAQIAGQLVHQNIVPVYAVGCQRGVHYYAMQYIEGQSLAEVIKELHACRGGEPSAESAGTLSVSPVMAVSENADSEPRPSDSRWSSSVPSLASSTSPVAVLSTQRSAKSVAYCRGVAKLGIQAANALEYAHQNGVIHRDVKPGNLLLDRKGNLWITDFGLARVETDGGLTLTGDVLGTLRYISPEQALAKRVVVDHRTDIYSLGVTLYELLTLQPAYDAVDRHELMRMIAFEEPPAPGRLNESIPGDLETIVLKAMSKNAAERYETAQEVSEDLTRFIQDQPILARRPTLLQRAGKWSRRHKPLVASLAAAICVIVVTMLAGSSLVAFRLNRIAAYERRVANREQQARREAESLANDAEALAEERRRELVQQYVAHSDRLQSEGDLAGSLVWLSEALKLDQGHLPEERIHAIRFQMLQRRLPKLRQAWFVNQRHASISLKGQRLATFRRGLGEVNLWNTATGDLVSTLNDDEPFSTIALSPDGRWLATASRNHSTVRLWDAQTCQPRWGPKKPRHPPLQITFSPDGSLLAVGCGYVELLDAHTGELIRSIETSSPVRAVTFSADGKRLVTFGDDARLWDTATGKPLGPKIVQTEFTPRRLSNPDGSPVSASDFGHPAVLYAAINPDGTRVLTVGDDHGVRVWDPTTGQRLQLFFLPGEQDVSMAAASPDMRRLMITDGFGTVQCFDVANGQRVTPTFQSESAIAQVSFTPDGRHLLVAKGDGTILLWDLDAQDLATSPWTGPGVIHDVFFASDGPRAIAARADGTVKTWDIERQQPVSPPIPHVAEIQCAAFSPDGNRIVTASNGHLRVWSAHTGQAVSPPLDHEGIANDVTFSHDAKLLAAAIRQSHPLAKTIEPKGAVVLWTADTFELVAVLPHSTWVNHVAFDTEGKLVAGATSPPENTVCLWDLETREVVRRLKHRKCVECAEFSADGSRIVSASSDQTSLVWDTKTGRPLTPPLVHRERVFYASFSADSRYVVTASEDDTARVWDSATGFAISPLLEHGGAVRRAWFSPDARRLITATVDGTAKVWDLSIDERSVEDLEATAIVLAGRQLGSDGNLQWVQRDVVRRNLRNLRSKYPDQFTSAAEDVVTWHQLQAIDCQKQQEWSAALWHLSRAIEMEPDNARVLASRARVAMKLEQWKRAAADLSAAVNLGVNDAQLRAERGRTYVKADSEMATIVPAGAMWRWLHPTDGTDPATNDDDFHQTFFHADYDDSQWQSGADSVGPVGGFGYGDPVGVDMGTPPRGLRKTAYFRHTFNTDTTFYDLSLSLQRDDAVIVNLDGVEVGRDQALHGPDAYDLLSTFGRGDPSERIVLRIPLSRTLDPGQHVSDLRQEIGEFYLQAGDKLPKLAPATNSD